MKNEDKVILKTFLQESKELSEYDVGETIEGLALRLGKRQSEIIKINSNENYFVPLDFLRRISREVAEEIDPRIYPRREYEELKIKLCEYLGVTTEEIILGSGSDPLIDLVSRIFLNRGDEAISITPTFSIYEKCVGIQKATYTAIPLKKDFSLDCKRIKESIKQETKIIFLCSPNNPTANLFDRDALSSLCEFFEGIVAIDEAYVDFSNGSTIFDSRSEFHNLILFRTFSKVFGLAGLRLGYAIANKDLATTIFDRFQMPYNVSLFTLKVARKILDNTEVINSAVKRIIIQRENLVDRLNKIRGIQTFNSETNFVVFRIDKSSKEVYDKLLRRGIIVRNIGSILGFENCLRVTVAPQPMMEKFLLELERVMKE